MHPNDARPHAPEPTDDTLALARQLGERLARQNQAGHEVRLARALMFDVVELLEASHGT